VLDLLDGGSQPEIGHLGHGATDFADDVVVVLRLTGDVGMVAAGQVDAFEHVELREEVEGPEDRGTADAQVLGAGVGEQVVGREMAVARGHQLSDGTPWFGETVAGLIEGSHEGFGRGHRQHRTQSRAS
jgi:hypothetical protein